MKLLILFKRWTGLMNCVCVYWLDKLVGNNDKFNNDGFINDVLAAAAAAAAAAAEAALFDSFNFFKWATRCSGGWKYLHVSRLHFPLIKSTQTITRVLSLSNGQFVGGCANWHSLAVFWHTPFWKSTHIFFSSNYFGKGMGKHIFIY